MAVDRNILRVLITLFELRPTHFLHRRYTRLVVSALACVRFKNISPRYFDSANAAPIKLYLHNYKANANRVEELKEGKGNDNL